MVCLQGIHAIPHMLTSASSVNILMAQHHLMISISYIKLRLYPDGDHAESKVNRYTITNAQINRTHAFPRDRW